METEYRYLEYGQLGELGTGHPDLQRIPTSNEHAPPWTLSLRSCPDIHDRFPCYFYLLSGARVVASVAALPDELFVEGRVLPWAWGSTLVTSPDCRGQGLASKLWAAVTQTFHENGITIAGAFANPVTTHICERMGFTITDRVGRLLLLKTARPFLSAHLPPGPLISMLDAPYRFVAKGIQVLTAAGRHRAVATRMEKLTHLDELGVRLAAATPCYDQACHFNDTVDKFRWKVSHCKNAEVYLITDSAGGEVLVRFVVKTRDVTSMFNEKYTGFRLMTLMDYVLFAEPQRSYGVLADAVVKLFWQSNAEVLETVSAAPALNAHLRRKLLIPGGAGVAFWYKTPPGVDVSPNASAISSWHFTHFCTDAFSFR